MLRELVTGSTSRQDRELLLTRVQVLSGLLYDAAKLAVLNMGVRPLSRYDRTYSEDCIFIEVNSGNFLVLRYTKPLRPLVDTPTPLPSLALFFMTAEAPRSRKELVRLAYAQEKTISLVWGNGICHTVFYWFDDTQPYIESMGLHPLTAQLLSGFILGD